GEGQVVAVEAHAGRADALRRTAQRLRAANVEGLHKAAREPFPGGPFARVLLDPPCTGLGTLRSHPDLRWRVTSQDVDRLAALQDELLDGARAALAPGRRPR